MTFYPVEINHTFDGVIGVDVKGEIWSCVEIPGSAELLGTKRTVRGDVEIDEMLLSNVGWMVTGTGGHMISLSAKVRKQLGKEIGDEVTVRLVRRTR